jgi:hypothetical protein
MKLLLLSCFFLMQYSFASECMSDAKKFCPEIKPGKGGLTLCLLKNKDQLSKACRKEILTPLETKDRGNPCHANLVEFCSEMPLSGEKLTYCLLKHETKLDNDCSKDFQKRKAEFVKKNVCAPDITEHCYPEVKGRDIELARCLMKKKEKLSKTCGTEVGKLSEKLRKENSCFDDIDKYCPKVVGPEKTQLCLEKNLTKLQPSCQTAVKKQKERIASHPCAKDLERLCKTAIGGRNKRKCLKTYESKLSKECKSYQNERMDKVTKLIKNCDADRKKLCQGISQKIPKIIRCLEQNEKKLSPNCKASLF